MPRGPRFAFAGAFYHVFNRGINKQTIFNSGSDFHFFLKNLRNLKIKYDCSLYAYCLMPNHFHLSIRTRKASISKIMASIGTSYSMYFNRTYNHFGSVFQNRFKSILVESDSYFLKLSQYIYLNPVKAGLVKNPLDYQYSSIREILGREPLQLLDQDVVRLIGETEVSRNDYERFILEGASEDFTDVEKLFEGEESVMGTDRFATSSQRKYTRKREGKIA